VYIRYNAAESDRETERHYFYQIGLTVTFAISTILLISLGAYVFVGNPALVTQTLVIFYVVLFLFGGIFGLWAAGAQARARDLTKGAIGGFIGLLLLLIASVAFQYLSTLQLLEVPPPAAIITPFENMVYQLVFVAITEEMIFRQTLPYILEWALGSRLSLRTTRFLSLYLISSFGFATLHYAAYALNFWSIVNAFVAGLILAFVRDGAIIGKKRTKEESVTWPGGEGTITVIQKTFGGLLACWIAHLLYNFIQISQLLVFPT
jgi:membrane protease YdiL (CAAX protease family)